ncbi:MAG: hypothetical protein HY344_04825 [Candidatus Levybacteria bacterium]|nr:hypothetical protein [Candidatus Levybacteria bacterium]
MNQLGWVNSACGHLFPLIISPFLLLKLGNNITIYSILLLPLFLSYLFFFKILFKKQSSEIKKIALLFILTFFFSIPGILGFYMGNVDIFLSLALGFIILLKFNEKKLLDKYGKLYSIFMGILLGAITNAKIFLFPFSVVFILFSKNIIFKFFSFLGSFIIITYLPNIFGSPTGILTFLNRVYLWNERVTVNFSPAYNHSPAALASYFTDCLKTQNCEAYPNNLLTLIIVLLTFVIAFFSRNFFKKKNLVKLISLLKSPILYKRYLLKLKTNKYSLIFLLTFITAFINLVPEIAFNYRLYYSLPIVLILLTETQNQTKAKFYCYLSMIFLVLGGLWIVNLSPSIKGIIDARLMNIFIIFHFIFLIKSSYLLLRSHTSSSIVKYRVQNS